MKKKRTEKVVKLSLKKEKIAELTKENLDKLKGGYGVSNFPSHCACTI